MFDAGKAASAGLEQLAEGGGADGLAAERVAADADSQGVVVAGEHGPIATQEFTSATINVDGRSNGFVSLAAMILPSNDAFIGTDEAVQLFSSNGRFLGAQTITFEGSDVHDAGTEVNTELDAAFINQTGPNTGVDENGVVGLHPGFNGSEGNPEGKGDQIILGGTNAFGFAIDPEAADFTRDGAQIAEIHINAVVERNGSDGRDTVFGRRDDDIIDGGGGNDNLRGGGGWDEIDGGAGNDRIAGNAGDDILNGGAGNDRVIGGSGDDIVGGGSGNDDLRGNSGDDIFIFGTGYDNEFIRDFHGGDQIALSVEGIDNFEDVLEVASEGRRGVELEFGGGDSLELRGVDLEDLSSSDFLFV